DRQPGGQPARAAPGSVSGGGALPRAPLRRGRAMKFFLDTASLKDISWATQAGLIDGITTNPSLLSTQAGDLAPRDVLTEICRLATEILAASMRHPRHVVEAAMIGADVATLPPDVLKKLLLHPLTDRGLEQFLADWSKLVARAKAAV